MNGRDVRLGVLAMTGLFFVSGCAGLKLREPAWPRLPSPWSTIKQSTPKSGLDTRLELPPADKPSATAFKPSKRSKEGKAEDTAAMALLNGMNCERAADWNSARRIYEGIRQKDPNNVEAIHRLGVVADSQRHHVEAEQLFLAALQIEPRNATILADLGYCYYLQGQLPKAESALNKATTLEPSNQRYWNNLGLVLGHQRRYEEALDAFRKSGAEADAQFNLAFVYAGQDRVEDAKRCFQAALATDPTHRRAREALTSFEEYEQLPAEVRSLETYTENGVRYVPYIEGSTQESGQGSVATAGHESASSSYTASRAARALYQEARGTRNANMASQRSEELSAQ
jgi:Flp pilus assembly protein TadD